MPSKTSQYSTALMQLRTLILSGELDAGKHLAETALAGRLGLSRTPLRQALSKLMEEGLLEQLPNGRCQVASFTRQDVADSIEMRGVIEGTAARLAAERGTDSASREACEKVLLELDRVVFHEHALPFQDYVDANAEFHRLLGRLAGSTVTTREVERICRLPLASPSAFLQCPELAHEFAQTLVQAQNQHRAIFEAIVNREGSRAEALTREHARLALQNLDYVLKSQPRYSDTIPGLALVVS